MKKKTPKIRLTLEFDQSMEDKFTKLLEATQSSSKSEVIRRSLALFELAIYHDSTVYIKDKNNAFTAIKIL